MTNADPCSSQVEDERKSRSSERERGDTQSASPEAVFAHTAVGDTRVPVYALDSPEGKQLAGAMNAIGRAMLARLQEAWAAQTNKGFCAPASVLAALKVLGLNGSWTQDRLWADVVVPRKLNTSGISLDNGAKLSHAVGMYTEVCCSYDEKVLEEALREDLATAFQHGEEDLCLLINYWRPSGGHWSPLGGFSEDHVLILDTAAFRMRPHWVPIKILVRNLCKHNDVTRKPRGYLTLRRREDSQA